MSVRIVPPLPSQVLLTAEEFLTHPEPESGRLELHDGRVVDVAPASYRHGLVRGRLARRLGAWCEERGLNEPLPELPCELTRRRVVAPDVGYVRGPVRAATALESGRLAGAPDLAVEVVSRRDSGPDVRQKVQWDLAAGCPLVWVIDPQRRSAAVWRLGAPARRVAGHLSEDDILDGEDVLPGFRLPLADLWGAPEGRPLGPR